MIYGAGPVGLMAALSATVKGAAKVMVVDRHPDRLRLAESIGCIAVDDSTTDPVRSCSTRRWGWARTVDVSAWVTRPTTRKAPRIRP